MTSCVIVLTPWYPTDRSPGNGTFIESQVDAMRRLGVECVPLIVRPKGRFHCSVVTAESDPSHKDLCEAVVRRDVCVVRKIATAVVAHAPGITGSLARALGLPYVVVLHGLRPMLGARQSRLDILGNYHIRTTLAGAHSIVAVSALLAADLPSSLRSNVNVIHNGVDLSLFFPSSQRVQRPHIVVTVGNLIRSKGHETLVRALAALRSEIDFQWVVIGDGPERARIGVLAERMGIGGRVRFTGVIPNHAVAAELRQATVFALPSRRESFGCVYLEAAASGVPVLAAQGSGIAEVLRDGESALFVDPRSHVSVAIGLRRLLSDRSLRESLAAQGLAVARSMSWLEQSRLLVQLLPS